jgi:NAD(P) transhydrogenase
MPRRKYDLVVIGSGPAGEKGAAQAAYFGKKVALIEKESVLGGTAANTGTIPSKTLRETALYLSGFQQRKLFGVDFRLKEKVTVPDFLSRERLVKESERNRIGENLKHHNVDLYSGTASFADPQTITIQPKHSPEIRIEADVFLIATGSYPYHPPVFPFHDFRVYDSDTILDLHAIPPSILIVGGGVIGCEYCCMFAALGIEVTLIENHNRLMRFLDYEISDSLQSQIERMGIGLEMPNSVESVEATQETLKVELRTGRVLKTHTILVATGRNGSVESLGLDGVGIETDKRGRILVNEHYQTSLPHIYAAGDVIGFPALASTSMEQARVAMVHAFDLKYKSKVAHILPYGVYTIPECSMAGETEQSLMAKNIPYIVGKAYYMQNPRGLIIGEEKGFLKLLFKQDDMRLLGVHVIGEQATEIVHVGLTAILMGAGVDLFIQTCYNYPTLTDMYKYAAYDALDRRARRVKSETPESRAETE